MRPLTPKPTRQLLRTIARGYLEDRRNFKLEAVIAPGRPPDAYFRCQDDDGESFEVAVRTAKNGRLAFRRKGDGWKTIDEADFVLIASFGDDEAAKSVDLYYIDAQTAVAALDEAYAALSPAKKKAKGTFPVWVSIEDVKEGRKAPGSGMINQAIDHITVPLDGTLRRNDTVLEEEEDISENFAAERILNLKDAIARRLGLPPSAVEISVRITI